MERWLFMALGRAERWLRGLADAAEVDRIAADRDSNQTLPVVATSLRYVPFECRSIFQTEPVNIDLRLPLW